MKKIFIFLTLLNSLVCFAQFTAIPDANFENYLEQNGMGDGVPNNGVVLTANIENITSLIIYSKGIQDLTGIEDFAAVELINCANNNLPLLDVSQNMNLWALNCQSSNVVELHLPPTTSLEILNCPEIFLTTLDISQNPGLEQLYCDINDIGSLDLTNNPVIDLVIATYNNITGVLDTSQNPLLTSISVSHNNISNIDLTQNLILLGFDATNNPLESLDVRNGNNENIATFNVYETSDYLKCILVDDASATYLDDWLKDPGTTFVNNQAECDALGLGDMESQNFALYPNPANELVNIILPDTASFILFDSNSKKLKSGLLNSGDNVLSVLGFDAGIYFIRIKTDQEVFTKKLVIY